MRTRIEHNGNGHTNIRIKRQIKHINPNNKQGERE